MRPVLIITILLYYYSAIFGESCMFGDDVKEFFNQSKRDTLGLVTKNGTCYALLIGLNDYVSNQHILQTLSKPENEIDSLNTLLSSQGYIVKALKGSQCTYETVIKWMNCIAERALKNDRIFIYFNGHGLRLSDINRDLCGSKSEQYKNTLVRLFQENKKWSVLNSDIWDTIRDSLAKNENCASMLPLLLKSDVVNEIINKTKTSHILARVNREDPLCLMLQQNDTQSVCEFISVEEIAQTMNRSSAHQKVLIIDACYSGDMNKLFHLPLDLYSSRIVDDGFFILTGTKRPQLQGKVSPIFLHALNGAADLRGAGNKDGYVSLYETTVFVDDSLQNDTSFTDLYKSRYVFVGSGEIRISKRKVDVK